MILAIGLIAMIAGAVFIGGDDDHRYYTSWRTTLLGIALVVIGLLLMFVWLSREDEKCSAKGGTYLRREHKCIDVQEIE